MQSVSMYSLCYGLKNIGVKFATQRMGLVVYTIKQIQQPETCLKQW
jgi:hypothetical protein